MQGPLSRRDVGRRGQLEQTAKNARHGVPPRLRRLHEVMLLQDSEQLGPVVGLELTQAAGGYPERQSGECWHVGSVSYGRDCLGQASQERMLLVPPDFLCSGPGNARMAPYRAQRALGDASLVAGYDDHAILALVFSCVDVFLAVSHKSNADLIQYPG